MKDADDLISEFKSLELNKYPIEKLRSLVLDIGHIGTILFTLHEGKIIYRARPTERNQVFSKKSDVSYLPPEKNLEYKRASTPNNTMFYGSILPENINPGELNEVRIVGCFECIPFLRDKTLDGEQKITFGSWIVTKDVPLLAIVHHQDFNDKSEYIKEMNSEYNKFMTGYPEIRDRTTKLIEYLASEFAKKSTDNQYNYLISALFTERIIEKGLAGVLYPSVRTDGEGFNVAIHPNFVESNMKLISVGVCTAYKKGNKTILDNELVAHINDDKEDFQYNSVLSKYHIGRENVLKLLNE